MHVLALQVADVQLVASRVLQNPVQLSLLCTSMCQCFEFDRTAAGLLLHTPQMGGTHSSTALQPADSAASQDTAPSPKEAEHAQHDSNADRQVDKPQGLQPGLVSLPRMPAGLAHISSQAAYEAVAGVARTAGRVAALAGVQLPYQMLLLLHVHLARQLPVT